MSSISREEELRWLARIDADKRFFTEMMRETASAHRQTAFETKSTLEKTLINVAAGACVLSVGLLNAIEHVLRFDIGLYLAWYCFVCSIGISIFAQHLSIEDNLRMHTMLTRTLTKVGVDDELTWEVGMWRKYLRISAFTLGICICLLGLFISFNMPFK